MARREFPESVKLAAFQRSGGFCEISIFQTHENTRDIMHLFPTSCDKVAKECDHILANGLKGDPVLENAAYLCRAHHKQKTDTDVAYMAKGRRFAVNRDRPPKTVTRSKSKFGKRENAWGDPKLKRTIGGKVVRRREK